MTIYNNNKNFFIYFRLSLQTIYFLLLNRKEVEYIPFMQYHEIFLAIIKNFKGNSDNSQRNVCLLIIGVLIKEKVNSNAMNKADSHKIILKSMQVT